MLQLIDELVKIGSYLESNFACMHNFAVSVLDVRTCRFDEISF